MIAILTGWGLSSRLAKIVGYIGVPLLVIALLWGALAWYGKARYNAGRADEELAWQQASDRLKEQAIHSAETAEEAAAEVEQLHSVEVALEKEKIRAAVAAGDSPFNVLFPSDGVQPEADR